ncbi:MAG: ribonuclease H-like YkuK family protein [Patescibacteria group bacterium]
MLDAMRTYMAHDPTRDYEIVIGTDSRAGERDVQFVTSVVFRRVGNGGIYFYTRTEERSVMTMRDRIWKEAMRSITLAQELRSVLREQFGDEIVWDKRITFQHIHLDIGTQGPTRELVDGVSGMVKGYGFEPVIKPDSYGAFVVADLHT